MTIPPFPCAGCGELFHEADWRYDIGEGQRGRCFCCRCVRDALLKFHVPGDLQITDLIRIGKENFLRRLKVGDKEIEFT